MTHNLESNINLSVRTLGSVSILLLSPLDSWRARARHADSEFWHALEV